MTGKKWLWTAYPILLTILVSCSAASARVLNTVTTDFTSTIVVTNTVPPTEPTDVPTQEITVTPSPSPGSALTEVVEEKSEYQCSDPFDGVSIRFSPDSWNTNFCNHSVSGGPPRDGIPPIDNPGFESVESADSWLEDQEPVISVEFLGESRAYPLQILIWHEIVNDIIGETPIVVTFCPLCNTGLVFERPIIGGEILTFGTSGNLRNSDLVMWDRQTESWWQQFTGEALVGDLTGTQLKIIPTSILSWSDFKTRYPDSQVLSVETGYIRNYGLNPYPGYDNVGQYPFLFDGPVDDRLLPMTRVLGIDYLGASTAYNMDKLMQDRVINDMLGEVPIVVKWKAGTASALDASMIALGRDVGTSRVFLRNLDELILTFSANNDGTFRDIETGSTWNIFGEAIDGPLAGKNLEAVPHHETFWFAWAAFIPDGTLVN